MQKKDKVRYKIGEISKILDIPIDTLRYFEKIGLIHPEIDEQNQYRYYDHWDINYLIEYKQLKALEFSQTECLDIQQKDDIQRHISRMDNRLEAIHEKAEYYQLLSVRMKDATDRLKEVSENFGKVRIETINGFYYFVHRFGNSYLESGKIGMVFQAWAENLPFADSLFVIPEKDIENNRNTFNGGFSVEEKWIAALRFTITPEVRHVPTGKAVSIIARAGDIGTFTYDLFRPALKYISDMNIQRRGNNVYGFLLARTHEADGYARYIKFFIPIY